MTLPSQTRRCIICGGEGDGISIREHLICQECERLITRVDVDNPIYKQICLQLRQIWRQSDT